MSTTTTDNLSWLAQQIQYTVCIPVSYTHLDVYKRQVRDEGQTETHGAVLKGKFPLGNVESLRK